MVDLGGMFGQGLQSGATAGIKGLRKQEEREFLAQSRLNEIDRRAKSKREAKKQEAKSKAYLKSIKDMGKFSDIVKLMEGEVGEGGEKLDDPKVKDRFKKRLTAFFLARNGNKMTPLARAEIDTLADREIGQLKAFAAGATMSAGKGNFNMRTYLNLLNSSEPTAAEDYLEKTVLEDVRDAKSSKDLALADKARAQADKARKESKLIDLKTAIMHRIAKRLKERRTGPGDDLGLARDLALVDPPASRAFRGIVGEMRLQPPGAVRTGIAKKMGEAIGENRKPLPTRTIQFLGLDPVSGKINPSAADLARPSEGRPRGIRIPTEKNIDILLKRESAARKVFDEIQEIIKLATNKPQLLTAPGAISRGITTIAGAFRGFANLLGADSFLPPASAQSLLNSLPVLRNLGETAGESAKLNSMIKDLTYKAASLVDQTGRALSDRDYEIMARTIAAGTGDPKVMIGVLRSFAMLTNRAFNIDFRSQTRITKFIGLPDSRLSAPFKDMSTKELSGVIKPILSGAQLDNYLAVLKDRRSTR